MFKGDKPQAPSNYNDKGIIHTDPNCPCYKLDNQGETNVSKILQQCKYEQEDYDLYIYCPKVSKKEREQGCENLKST